MKKWETIAAVALSRWTNLRPSNSALADQVRDSVMGQETNLAFRPIIPLLQEPSFTWGNRWKHIHPPAATVMLCMNVFQAKLDGTPLSEPVLTLPHTRQLSNDHVTPTSTEITPYLQSKRARSTTTTSVEAVEINQLFHEGHTIQKTFLLVLTLLGRNDCVHPLAYILPIPVMLLCTV